MKMKILAVAAIASILMFVQPAPAAETNDISTDLRALVTKIQDKLKDGKKAEADFAPELKEFDTLLANHKDAKPDDLAQVEFMKAMLYLQVFDEPDKGTELIKKVKTDYPDSKLAKNADTILASLQKEEESKKIQSTLVEGAKFPDFDEQGLDGKPLSVAGYKGKVVLVDFWATWCGPCRAELPNVLKTYEKHHSDGFEIVGVSLDEDKAKLESFLKDNKMTWRQYFDGKGWENKLAGKYGITAIPATFLLDGEGNIIGRDLRGEELESAVTKALAAK